MIIIPTKAEIEAARTPAGGWTRDQLAQWGFSWPPQKGWKERLERMSEAAPTPTEVAEMDEEHRHFGIGILIGLLASFPFWALLAWVMGRV